MKSCLIVLLLLGFQSFASGKPEEIKRKAVSFFNDSRISMVRGEYKAMSFTSEYGKCVEED